VDYYSILTEELVPALGCTEPIALAYGSALCRKTLGVKPSSIEVKASGNIIKNVKAVVVPNCGGLKGIEAAVAAGALAGDSDKGLEVLSTVKAETLPEIKEYLKNVKVSLLDTTAKLHILITMKAGESYAVVEIIHQHMNVVRLEKDDKVLLEKSREDVVDSNTSDRSGMSVSSILEFANSADLERLKPIIEPQIINNTKICQEGLENKWGASVGRTVLDSYEAKAEAMAAAGSDARMSGCSLPVIINSGSGNQGITVSVPVIEYATSHNIEHERLIRALALSNLLAIYQKTQIGRLSAYCGVVCAACGSGAAITYLSGGGEEEINETIVNTLATISGMMCDGAKPSCAGKIAVAVHAAHLAHEMAMSGRTYNDGEGIVKENVEKTVSSIGTIAREGMSDTDKVILSVMLEDK